MTISHQKFTFDTVFDSATGAVIAAPRPKRAFTVDEVEQVRAQAFAEGERSGVVRAEQAAAAALAEIGQAATAALSALTRLVHDHRTVSAELALAAGRTIAGAALEQFPEAPAAAALAAMAREMETTPRLAVRTSADLAERLQAALEETAQRCGYAGQIVVRGDPALPTAAFVLDWGDGRASFDPVEAAQRVTEALRSAVEAEGLHAEPVLPQSET
jgi:flagellar assembly protein FliH